MSLKDPLSELNVPMVNKSEYLTYSSKGEKLLSIYGRIASQGFEEKISGQNNSVYNEFDLKNFKTTVQDLFKRNDIKYVLDYGCGFSNWSNLNFSDKGESAIQFFALEEVFYYEPARNLDQRKPVDCVLSFSVLEHVFVSDIPAVLRDIFSLATKLVLINIACYESNAVLPNGENTHVTVRHPAWWKGMVDCISTEFPELEVALLTSVEYGKAHIFPVFSDLSRHQDKNFAIQY